ncbi:uncharacterized protein LOC112270969 [Brachypodium distachyon]|uniref:F-box domain-containing protein n=1 Tax=Brachypodium distachyon TaxID=15368 RepID=I1HHA2_BRADI|nr:uncharacterized protein LOC112270969 [Brachypodium distachyon]PNT70839.1 hypothetical protein BRADI_2g18943v3 [Brachypodium distachyon]|eukprot:XP_024315537.1 uncharacterized protein LOC112270969 [Brachypodium distachyon]
MEESLPPELPLDLLAEILSRCDPRTVVRFGTACKLLWRHVSDPALRARLRARLPAADRFLLGLLYQHSSPAPLFAAPSSSGSRHLPNGVASSMSAALMDRHEPVASRGGLVVLRSWERPLELAVCDPAAGRGGFLPPCDVHPDAYALLLPQDYDDGDAGAGGSDVDPRFELLVMDMDEGIRTQTFSSVSRAWGPVVSDAATGGGVRIPYGYRQVQPTTTVVIGGVAYWLYRGGLFAPPPPTRHSYRVLALDVATGHATWTEVPERCHKLRRMPLVGGSNEPKELLLVPYSPPPSPPSKKKVGLLVSELMAISMWVLDDDDGGTTWAKHVVVDRERVLGQVQHCLYGPLALAVRAMELESVAERSGTVVMQMHGVGIFLLNLQTLQVHQLQTSLHVKSFARYPFCVYELDLISLIPSK